MSIKQRIKNEFKRRKNEISTPEYILWWVIRLSIFGAFFYSYGNIPPALSLSIACNFVATFAVSLLSFIFPAKLLLGRLPYRVQTYVGIFTFLGAVLNQALDVGRYIDNYDKYLHVFSGFLVVFMGCYIFKSLAPDKNPDDKQMIFASFGFSYFVAAFWEIFEFMADFFIPGSTNQGYNIGIDYSMLFFKIFGHGAENMNQAPLMDTMLDLIAALVGSVVAVIILVIITKRKKVTEVDLTKTECRSSSEESEALKS